MPRPQDYATHRRYFPLYHFVVLPALVVNFVWSVRHAMGSPDAWNIWTAVMAFVLVLFALAARVMALAVQNRVIRLEMRLRFGALLPPALAARAAGLSTRQVVALRFAGDAELPPLVERCLAGEFAAPKDIKLAIRDWQPDWLRA
ncbi:MAG TPA: DUF6526 family protein [Gemmatimonadaceae bacterium]|nr:DUF6526 family protein [Gemmatimonadaceae bacterium]